MAEYDDDEDDYGLDFVFQDWLNPETFTNHRLETFNFDINMKFDDTNNNSDGLIRIQQGVFQHTKENDQTGAVVWDDAVMLAWHLISKEKQFFFGKNILELGSGTGFLGIAISTGCKANVYISDRPVMRSLIEKNIEKNQNVLQNNKGTICQWVEHSWGENLNNTLQRKSPFDIIIASGCIYHEEANPLLLNSLEKLSSRALTKIYFAIDFRFDVSQDKQTGTVEGDQYIAPVIDSFLKQAKKRGLIMKQISKNELNLCESKQKKSVRLYECKWTVNE